MHHQFTQKKTIEGTEEGIDVGNEWIYMDDW